MNHNSENKNVDFRKEFKPLAKKYRFYKRILYVTFFLLVAVGIVGALFLESGNHPASLKGALFFIIGVTLIFCAFFLYAFLKSMDCPRCKKDFSNTCQDSFCSYCGGEMILSHPARGPHCGSCNRPKQQGNGKRLFILRFRYCNQCGCHLSDELM